MADKCRNYLRSIRKRHHGQKENILHLWRPVCGWGVRHVKVQKSEDGD